jgi:hypothetical protein
MEKGGSRVKNYFGSLGYQSQEQIWSRFEQICPFFWWVYAEIGVKSEI